jgi:NAD(P)-dependent dehydrogenase (short-subunit alcohol dehydrogenase family)
MADPDNAMRGKVCLITGATSGIGLVTAFELARKGATLVLASRSPEKCATIAEQIRRETGNPAIEYLAADLSQRSQVQRLAEEFKAKHERLHVLINNAGALYNSRRESADGIELTFALNHLAYFLLTNQLLDVLKSSTPSRIVNVASDAHTWVKGLNFDDLQWRQSYKPFRVYAATKLANILFTRELARRLEGSGVSANSLHPGFVATNFMAGNGLIGWFMRLATVMAISPAEGAKTTIYLANSPEVEGVSGRYFAKCREATPSAAACDAEASRQLWQVSEYLTDFKATAEMF